MPAHRWRDIRRGKMTREQLSAVDLRVRETLLEMDLKEIREMLGKTQTEVAKALEVSQGQVSETERREDFLLSTLRRYVEALGGELEVIANFGDKRIRLHAV